MKYLRMYSLVVVGFIAVIGVRSLVRGVNLFPRAWDNIGSNILWSVAAFLFIVRMEERRERQKQNNS